MAAPVKTVAIVGRDAPLWLAANVLQAALPISVRVVELPSLLRPADVQATLPAIEALHNLLGIEEAHLLKTTGGAFSLGQSFRDGERGFFHPYGSVGAPIGDQPFLQHWVKAGQFGLAVAFEDFSLTAAAARQGRMMLPGKETEGFARTDYGYHLPAPAYAGYLKGLALRRGVRARQTAAIHVHLDAESGAIQGIGLEGGERVEADLYLDATGPEALLIGGDRESWRGYFPCDRILTLAGERFGSVPIFGQIRAQAFGWLGFYPTQRGTGLLAAYDSAAFSAEEVLQAVSRMAKVEPGEALMSSSAPGRRKEAWVRNCIALGDAACTFDPVHSVDLQAVQMALVHLLALFPVTEEFEAERREYNRLMASGYDRLCDFQAAHYTLKRGTPRSEALAHKIETFRARGIIPLLDDESFPLESWQSLFLGHGLMPESWIPAIDAVPGETMKQGFKTILTRIKQLVEQQPSHDSYLEIFCS